jgi:hypothetical protein
MSRKANQTAQTTPGPAFNVGPKMRFNHSKWFFALALLSGIYVGSFATIKLSRPAFLTTNDGPGRIYCTAFLPLRFAVASTQKEFWKSQAGGHWQTVKVVWNNAGNGYLEFDDLEGRPGRIFSGSDLAGATEGEVIDIHRSYELKTWDDFSDHLIAGIDKVKRSSQPSRPASPLI